MSNLVPIQKQQQLSGPLAIESMDDLARLSDMMVKSGFFEDCKSAAQAGAKIIAGLEIGVPAFASLSGIHIIKGKAAIGANLMAAKVKGSGKYDYRVTRHDDQACIITFYQGKEPIGTSEFTIEDARKMGTQNMQKMPRNMLFARAMSNGVKWYCPDIFLGAPVYTPEELGAQVDDDGKVLNVTVEDVTPQPDPWVTERLTQIMQRTELGMDDLAKIAAKKKIDLSAPTSAQLEYVRDAAYASAMSEFFPSAKAAWDAYRAMDRQEDWSDEGLWQEWERTVKGMIASESVTAEVVEEEF